MRPLRLTMQAFGPYPDRVVLDFREAVEAGLFGIYGQTGSGKSTIFSAMTFALFGEAAKDDQDPASLRSDHADAALPTEVEFVFEIGERRFVVLRRPEQMRPKQRGDGATRSAHEAFLFDATGFALEAITEEQRGKIIAEKKVGVVDAAVSELLGYGASQFRQIVLLPQGRFEKFLAAKTKERLDILRDLFDVSLYRNLAARLKAEAAEAERHVIAEREICARRLTAEGFESTDALVAGIAEAEEVSAAARDAEAEARSLWTAAQARLEQAKALERQFVAAEEARKLLAGLLAGKAEMDVLEARVVRAERARVLRDAENAVAENAADRRAAETKLQVVTEALARATAREKSAGDVLAAEMSRAGELDALRQELEVLGRLALTLDRAEGVSKSLAEARAAERMAQENVVGLQKRLDGLRQAREARTAKLKLARDHEMQRRDIGARLSTLRAQLGAAEAFERAERDVAVAVKDVEDRTGAHQAALAADVLALQAFEAAERSLAEVQALHLASRLSPGEACPVCGSTDHPMLASGALEHAGLDKAFRDTKRDLADANAATRRTEQALAVATGLLVERRERLEGLARPEDTALSLKEQVRAAESGLSALGPEVDIAALEGEIERLRLEFETGEAEAARLRDVWSDGSRDAAALQATLEEMLSDVPQDLLRKSALADRQARVKLDLTGRAEARDAAERAAVSAREAALGAGKDVEAAVTARDLAAERHVRSLGVFEARLAEAGLAEDEYRQLKAFFDTIESDRERIENYRRRIVAVEDAAAKAADLVAGQVPPDVPVLKLETEAAEQRMNDAVKTRAGAEQRLQHRVRLRDELAETLRKLDAAEAASGPLRNLAALFNGDNPQKLDLETFAIGAMFDQVLAAANMRLGPMTAHRYRLERDLEGGGRGRRGLGIQAFDSHTGKARPTATLSGGETFIAALALALGLADVVESASGKVRLDTIFIDEGFGSLDTENGSGTLDIVLQVLGTLVSQNRAVGLISHVPLVQEAIPNGFYVRKQLAGSSVETRGVL
ncbi:AAA family ATPase [Rhizobium sp. C4]|uniref:AAA family ATPase n=1 Tax=Rhizobium sp. C4 TaxID=1349800 RepID=UPI001E5A09EF|nr:SMC family ATPase [Rhizobium sp. C4]MCD2176120.1 SMC family ATPase [Rhizobium sp. C4]